MYPTGRSVRTGLSRPALQTPIRFAGIYDDLALENQQHQLEVATIQAQEEAARTQQLAENRKIAALTAQQQALQDRAQLTEQQLAILDQPLMMYGNKSLTGRDMMEVLQRLSPKLSRLQFNYSAELFDQIARNVALAPLAFRDMDLRKIHAFFPQASQVLIQNTLDKLEAVKLVEKTDLFPPIASFYGHLQKRQPEVTLYRITADGKNLLKKLRRNELDLARQDVRQLTEKAVQLGAMLPKPNQKPEPPGMSVMTAAGKFITVPMRISPAEQLRTLLTAGSLGLTGFELLQSIRQVGAKHWWNKTTIKQHELWKSMQLTHPPADNPMKALQAAGYIVRIGGTAENPKWKLTEEALGVLKYPSTDALINSGELRKTDLKAFLQLEIDTVLGQQAAQKKFIEQLEAHPEAPEDVAQERLAQLTAARNNYEQTREPVEALIAKLREKQARLDLTQDNLILSQMLNESQALVSDATHRLNSSLQGIDVAYYTSHALLNLDGELARQNVQSRITQRLTQNQMPKAAMTVPAQVNTGGAS